MAIPKKPNAFLQKQEELNQKFLNIGMDTGFQKCWDLIRLCLRDPEVVGKDTFGRKRIEKLFHALQKYDCLGCWDCMIKRPPQSWCYVEEV